MASPEGLQPGLRSGRTASVAVLQRACARDGGGFMRRCSCGGVPIDRDRRRAIASPPPGGLDPAASARQRSAQARRGPTPRHPGEARSTPESAGVPDSGARGRLRGSTAGRRRCRRTWKRVPARPPASPGDANDSPPRPATQPSAFCRRKAVRAPWWPAAARRPAMTSPMDAAAGWASARTPSRNRRPLSAARRPPAHRPTAHPTSDCPRRRSPRTGGLPRRSPWAWPGRPRAAASATAPPP